MLAPFGPPPLKVWLRPCALLRMPAYTPSDSRHLAHGGVAVWQADRLNVAVKLDGGVDVQKRDVIINCERIVLRMYEDLIDVIIFQARRGLVLVVTT